MTVNALAGFCDPDRRRHLVRPPRPPAAVHRRRRRGHRRRADRRRARATAPRTSPSAWRPALVYTGLNALTTAHRAIVAEDVEDSGRPAATSAQEIAGLVGAVVAVAIGGALIEPAPAAAFALAPVVLVAHGRADAPRDPPAASGRAPARASKTADRARRACASVMRRPGAREVLVAQTLWVFGYAALPAFFVLYAERQPRPGRGGRRARCRSRFGALTALGILLAGRAPARARAPAARDRGGAARAPACWRPRPRRASPAAAVRLRRRRARRGARHRRSASPTSRASCPRARRAATAACSSPGARWPRRPRCRSPASRSS